MDKQRYFIVGFYGETKGGRPFWTSQPFTKKRFPSQDELIDYFSEKIMESADKGRISVLGISEVTKEELAIFFNKKY